MHGRRECAIQLVHGTSRGLQGGIKTNKINTSGPRILPCGTPNETGAIDVMWFLI
jgi:hypothetical protein